MEILKCSVVIPVHNCATTILETLTSLVNQKEHFDELIIVDDGSTDNSMVLIANFLRQPANKVIKPRIITNPKSLGLARSYNLGISKANNSLIVLMHADVILKSKALSKLLAPFINNSSIVATYHVVDHPYEIWNTYNFWQKCFFSRLVGKKFKGLDGKFDCFKKTALTKVGGFDADTFFRAGEDGDIINKLKKIGQVISTDAEIIHIHDRDPYFSWKKIVYKQAQYSQAQGALLKRYGIINFNNFLKTFFREILLISLLIPKVNLIAYLGIIGYTVMYTKQMYLRQYRNPRIILIPILNLWLLLISLIFSTKGYIYGKQTI